MDCSFPACLLVLVLVLFVCADEGSEVESEMDEELDDSSGTSSQKRENGAEPGISRWVACSPFESGGSQASWIQFTASTSSQVLRLTDSAAPQEIPHCSLKDIKVYFSS